jgi:hypothetical protein
MVRFVTEASNFPGRGIRSKEKILNWLQHSIQLHMKNLDSFEDGLSTILKEAAMMSPEARANALSTDLHQVFEAGCAIYSPLTYMIVAMSQFPGMQSAVIH